MEVHIVTNQSTQQVVVSKSIHIPRDHENMQKEDAISSEDVLLLLLLNLPDNLAPRE